ncbi:hypothetical protein ACFVWG_23910 [Kribbella sp. NPDC058245]|uniref:hypothetical protein n=1 Tax=Kribbella sp. NPDC058245 TaxID=3346399 RepID=UPI0036E09EBC
MSDWTDLANGTAAAVVGVAGIVGTFLGGRNASREARQHARLEGIFEGLTSLMIDIRFHLRGRDDEDFVALSDEVEDRIVERFGVAATGVQLYAGPKVVKALNSMVPFFDEALDMLRTSEKLSSKVMRKKFGVAMDDLVDAMRSELALPRFALRRRRARFALLRRTIARLDPRDRTDARVGS